MCEQRRSRIYEAVCLGKLPNTTEMHFRPATSKPHTKKRCIWGLDPSWLVA